MILTYAGQPLLLEDPEGAVARFLASHIDTRQNQLFGAEPSVLACQRNNAQVSGTSPVCLPVFNYPERPRLELNQLYWPTGAMRWACGLFLVDGQTLNTIANVIATTDYGDPSAAITKLKVSGATLVINDELGATAGSGSWSANTGYSVGAEVGNAGNVYRCIGEGTSASSGGPTGMGSGIADGTVTWDYVEPETPYFRATMYVLAPRRVTPVNATDDDGETLWLLPLVDQRYWWQYSGCPLESISSAPTWEQITVSMASTGYGGILLPNPVFDNGGVPRGYLEPHTGELVRNFENYPLLLDAVAACTGTRLVFAIPDTSERQDSSPSARLNDKRSAIETFDVQYQSWIDSGGTAGGKNVGNNFLMGASVPHVLRLLFRDAELNYVTNYRDAYAGDHGHQEWVRDAVKHVHTTAFATTVEEEATLDPDTQWILDIENLIWQYADDFFGWLLRRFDMTAPGIRIWKQTGFDDATVWSIGSRNADGGFTGSTRVYSLPNDFGVSTALITNGTVYGPWFLVVGHPFKEQIDGGDWQANRVDEIYCIPVPYRDADGVLQWATETPIELDGSTLTFSGADPDPIASHGVDLTPMLVRLTGPIGHPTSGAFIGAPFPGELIKTASSPFGSYAVGVSNLAPKGIVSESGTPKRFTFTSEGGAGTVEATCSVFGDATVSVADVVHAAYFGGSYEIRDRLCSGDT